MSLPVFILLVLFGISLLCALLIISAAIVSSRSTKRLAAKRPVDLAEEAEALRALTAASTPSKEATKTKEATKMTTYP